MSPGDSGRLQRGDERGKIKITGTTIPGAEFPTQEESGKSFF